MRDTGRKVRYLQPQQVWGNRARTCSLRVRWLRPEVDWRSLVEHCGGDVEAAPGFIFPHILLAAGSFDF